MNTWTIISTKKGIEKAMWDFLNKCVFYDLNVNKYHLLCDMVLSVIIDQKIGNYCWLYNAIILINKEQLEGHFVYVNFDQNDNGLKGYCPIGT